MAIDVSTRERRAGQEAALEVFAQVNLGHAAPGAVSDALMALLDDAGLQPVPSEIKNRLSGFGDAVQRALAMNIAG